MAWMSGIRNKGKGYRNVKWSVGAIRAKDSGYRNVATFIVAVQDIAAV